MNVDPGVLLIAIAALVVFIFVVNALGGSKRSSSRSRNRFPGNLPPQQGLGFTSSSFDSSDDTSYNPSPDPLRTFVAAELIHQAMEHHHGTHHSVPDLQQPVSDSTPSFDDLPPVEADTSSSYDSSSSSSDSSSSFDSSSSDSSSFDSGSSDSSSSDCGSSSSDS